MNTPLRRRTVLGAAVASLPVLALAACGEVTVEGSEKDASAQLSITDDQGREVVLAGAVQRAVVVNSYTNEFVRAIGAGTGWWEWIGPPWTACPTSPSRTTR